MVSAVIRARKVLAGVRSDLGRRCLRRGVAGDPAHMAVLARLAPTLVIDVGANRGQFALATLTTTAAAVVCFEPLAGPRRSIEDLLVPTGRVSTRPVALGATAGTADIHVTHADDSSSLLAPTALQVATFPGSRETATETVTVSTLDAEFAAGAVEIGADTLLKIDVQGYELQVLRGATAVLAQVRWVLVEVSFADLYDGQCTPGEIIEHLAAAGLRLTGVVDVLRAGGQVVQADLLFERQP